MKLSDFETKDIVNVINGSKLGKLTDLEIDLTTGKIEKIILSNSSRFASFFSNANLINISWDDIIKIGQEVIIVNYSGSSK